MKISEDKLREVIKEEVINELFGFLKKKDKKKKKEIYSSSKEKQLQKFISMLFNTKKEIIDFKYNPKSPLKNKNNPVELYDYVSSAIDGYNLFEEKIFPVISAISGPLKENNFKYEKFKYPLHIGFTFFDQFGSVEISSMSTIQLRKLASDYYKKLSESERKQINSLAKFYSRIFAYMKQNDLIEFLTQQVQAIYDLIQDEQPEDRTSVELDKNIPKGILPKEKPDYLSKVSSAKKRPSYLDKISTARK